MLYFAAASFSETARRLEKPDLTGSAFLLAIMPISGPPQDPAQKPPFDLGPRQIQINGNNC